MIKLVFAAPLLNSALRIRSKSKDWLAQNQEWSDSLQRTAVSVRINLKIQLRVLV